MRTNPVINLLYTSFSLSNELNDLMVQRQFGVAADVHIHPGPNQTQLLLFSAICMFLI